MALASASRRRLNRLVLEMCNPFFWIVLPLSIFALVQIFSPPTPLWQYLVGMPVAAWVIWRFCANLWDSFWGSYERLVIVANESICIKDYWSSWSECLSSGEEFDDGSLTLVKVARRNGYFLLANIDALECVLSRRGCCSLSDFIDSWHDPDEIVECFEGMRESLAEETSRIKSGRLKSLTLSEIERLISDVDVLIEVARDLGLKGYKAKLSLLSQDDWNPDIHWRYRERGFCI